MDINSNVDLDELLKHYYHYRLAQDVGDRALDFVTNRSKNKLDEKEKLLSIMQKQRELGLPMDSDDYEDATNNGKSFYSQIMNSTGKRVLQAIPGPRALDHTPRPFFRIAEAVTDELPSVINKTKSGGKYGRYAARAASALFAL